MFRLKRAKVLHHPHYLKEQTHHKHVRLARCKRQQQ